MRKFKVYKSRDGSLLAPSRIKFLFESRFFEAAICCLREDEEKITRKKVIKLINEKLVEEGHNYFYYFEEKQGDYIQITNEDKELSKKLFPEFY